MIPKRWRRKPPIDLERQREDAARRAMIHAFDAPLMVVRCIINELQKRDELPEWVLERLVDFRKQPELLYRELQHRYKVRIGAV